MLETVLYAPLRVRAPPKISSVIIAAGVTRNLAHQQQHRCHQLVTPLSARLTLDLSPHVGVPCMDGPGTTLAGR